MKKKLVVFALLILLACQPLLSLAYGPPLERYSQLPESMAQFQPEGYTFTDGILVEGGVAYLLFYNGTYHYLYILKQDANGAWQRVVHSNKAIPAGTDRFYVGGDSPTTVYVSKSEDSYFVFSNRDGIWKLGGFYKNTPERETYIEYADDKITFHDFSNINDTPSSVYGVYQRDLRYLNISQIPFTLKDARATLTQVPSIPVGELTAQRIKFTGGQKYEVYSAPSTASLRGGNGKAIVSTNDWIQVFGQENGFILIQYDISSTHMRMGYIDAASLPRNATVNALNLQRQNRVMAYAAALTDDPLFSQTALAQLTQGQQVTLLANMGTWAYVETTVNGLTARGFVPQDALMQLLDLSQIPGGLYSDTKAFAQYQAKVVVERGADNSITGISVYTVLPQAWKTPASGVDALVGYRLYEGNRASYQLSGWEDYQGLSVIRYTQGFVTQADVLGLVPVYALSGEKAEESLVVTLK